MASSQELGQLGKHAIWEQLATFLDSLGRDAVLLILPPFAGIDRPSLGLHTLQASAAQSGREIRVLYANLLFAQLIGEMKYESLCYAPTSDLLGERIFAVAAYGAKYPGLRREGLKHFRTAQRAVELVGDEELGGLQALACEFVRLLGSTVARYRFPVIGCNSTFEQTSAAIALLAEIKRCWPEVITLIGGANCEGQMAHGVLSLCLAINYVFSGESEETFPRLLQALPECSPSVRSVIQGEPCQDLDAIPDLNYTDYYLQLANLSKQEFLHRSGSIWLPYETSRGCWWGQKHHCTFCGINGGGMTFRQKSPDVVLRQLPKLLGKHPTKKVLMVDNIMPMDYFRTLLPRLATLELGMHAFYEQKANLSLRRVELLKAAGVAVIQPGIEALSSELLRLMRKGVSASQNLALLRYARSQNVSVNWNLLYAFPGDEEEHYETTLALLPLISHLNPPSGACHLSIDRFSPYFDRREDYGIANVRPMEAYESIFPDSVNASTIAYHFVADYDCATRRDTTIVPRLEAQVDCWRAAWSHPETKAPVLAIEQVCENLYLLCDTRPSGSSKNRLSFIDADQARVALSATARHELSENLRRWAIEDARVAVELDGRVIPLATGRPEIIERFETQGHTLRDRVVPIVAAQ